MIQRPLEKSRICPLVERIPNVVKAEIVLRLSCENPAPPNPRRQNHDTIHRTAGYIHMPTRPDAHILTEQGDALRGILEEKAEHQPHDFAFARVGYAGEVRQFP